MRRLLSIILVLALACSALLSSCNLNGQNSNENKTDPDFEIIAMPGETSLGLSYELDDSGEGYVLLGRGEFTGDTLVIPAEHKGKPVTAIAKEAFQFDKELVAVYISDSVKIIGESAFSYCSNVKTVRIGTGVTFISQFSFISTEVEKIVLPNSVEFIDYTAFWNCKSLHTIALGRGITQLGGAYESDSDGNVKDVEFSGFSDFLGCTSLVKILVEESHPSFKTVGGHLFSKDGATIVKYAIGNTNTEFSLDPSVTTIGRGAFCGASNLLSFVIPDTVTTVSEFSFSDCASLVSVDIGASVSYIGMYAFDYCYALEAIRVSDENQYYYHADGGCLYSRGGKLLRYNIASDKTVFDTSESINEIDFSAFRDAVNLKEIRLPSGLTRINPQAFFGCKNLEKVVIPATVEYIGFFAFNNCEKLEVIEFEGTVDQWNNIEKDSSWDYSISGITVKCIGDK